jgi:hypothetical protein
MPGLAIAKQICLFGIFWAIQVLVFPFCIAWAAPVQIVTAAVAAAFAVRGLGCAIKTDPTLAAGAAHLCGWVEAVSREAFTPGTPLVQGNLGSCSKAGVEFLVAFVFTASSLLPVRGPSACMVSELSCCRS